MTLQEALRSGKPFRKKGTLEWKTLNCRLCYSINEVLADDWEVKQEPREKWIILTTQGAFLGICDSEKAARDQSGNWYYPECEIIRMREVVGE